MARCRLSTRTMAGLAVGLGGSMAVHAQQAVPAEGRPEEVIVTGTYLRSPRFTPSSPVDTLSREDMDVAVPTTVATYFTELPYNVGSSFTTGRALGDSGGAGTINLRGLGSGATLVLVNSKRQTPVGAPLYQGNVVDVNSLMPQIMIGNIEILKDGASALYGTDAVAGVVNFITRDDFDGLELRAQGEYMTYETHGDRRFGALWGSQGERGRLSAALEYYERDRIPQLDIEAFEGRSILSTLGSPGQFTVPNFITPTTNAAGNLVAVNGTTRTIRDPDCGRVPGSIPQGASGCAYSFAADQSYNSGERRYQMYLQGSYDITDSLVFNAEAGYTDSHARTTDTASGQFGVAQRIPGDNPGVVAAGIFRATDAAGQPLFAVPSAPGSTLPLRDGSGRVVLTDNPTDPASGIPFNYDVSFLGRPIGSQGGLPTQGTTPEGAFATTRMGEDKTNVLRGSVGLSGSIGADWHWEFSTTYSQHRINTTGQRTNELLREFGLAVQGLGGYNCNPATGTPGQGTCYYFNPFGNAIFAAPDSAAANTQEVISFFTPALWDQFESSLTVHEAVVSGELFTLPAGRLGVAAGVQYRDQDMVNNYDTEKNSGNIETGLVFADFSADRTTRAAFVEIAVPVVDNDRFGSLDLNGAVRYEDGGPELETTNPKIGLLYRTPGETLGVRASWGTSFLAPSLFQQHSSSAGATFVSPTPGAPATLRVNTLLRGNPDLKPQEAESWSAGVTWRPLPTLSFDVSYWTFHFDDLLATENAQQILFADPFGPRVIRDPVTGTVLVIQTQYFNAASMATSGIDVVAGYSLDLERFGSLAFNLNATYVDQYDLQALPGAPVIDATGRWNSLTFGAPSIPWRANFRTSWQLGGHSITATLRYTDSFVNDRATATPGDRTFEPYLPLDLTYAYDVRRPLGPVRSLNLAIGAQNVFDDLPDTVDFLNHMAANVYDYRGRLVWARVRANF